MQTSDITRLTVWSEAERILGKNFFGLRHTIKYLLPEMTTQEEALYTSQLAHIPCAPHILENYRGSLFVCAALPVSILYMRRYLGGSGPRLFAQTTVQDSASCMVRRGTGASWLMLVRQPVTGSFGKPLQDAIKLMNSNVLNIPFAHEVVYASLAHARHTGERLFDECLVRCADTTQVEIEGEKGRIHRVEGRICVGRFDKGGIRIERVANIEKRNDVGLAQARSHT